MTANNVVVFPKQNSMLPQIPSLEEIMMNRNLLNAEVIEVASMQLGEDLIGAIQTMGFDVLTEECLGDTVLIVEAIKSILYRSAKMHHSLHDVVEKIVSVPENFIEELISEESEED
jgi:hypothetical protein